MKSFLGNFYRRLAIFFWSHCFRCKANRSAVRYDFTTRVTPYPEGRCLWLSWQSGRFRYLRSMVRIQTSAKFYIEHIYCKLLKRQNKAKRGRKWLILKKTLYPDKVITMHCVKIFYFCSWQLLLIPTSGHTARHWHAMNGFILMECAISKNPFLPS